jgi:3-(3-hydroxy-phenyl)propionate hydroxylase
VIASNNKSHAVVIVGGGPTGLMLAAELALAHVDVVVVERRATQELDGPRARGMNARTLEVLDQRGVVDRFIAEGEAMEIQAFAGIMLEVGDLPSRHPGGLALWQRDIERVLAAWVAELGVQVLRDREVVDVVQHDDGVDVSLADGTTVHGEYVVGCDGGRSVVRKAAAIDFVGWDATTSWLIAEVEMREEPEIGVRHEGGGIGPVNRERGGNPYQIVLTEVQVEQEREPTLDDVRDALVAAYGTDFGLHAATWISRFTDMTRQAAEYRRGRVLLAGDAAHVHPPQGGQGLNLGVQDAVNLGWKLAQVVHGISPDDLFDTYHAERHPVGERVLQSTMAMVALGDADERHQALRDLVAELLRLDEPRTHLAAQLAGLDIRYALGDGHPLLGRRTPDLDLRTADGPTRVFELLHDARPVLLHFDGPPTIDVPDHVRIVDAVYDGVWVLPVVGEVNPPAAVLIRPDGYVAWVGDR